MVVTPWPRNGATVGQAGDLSGPGPTVAGVTTSDSLDQVWAQLTARLDQLGVPVFPAMPDTDCLSVADWPDTDWAAFLDVAARVAPPVLYAHPHRIAAAQLAALSEAGAALAAAEPEDAEDADDAGLGDEPSVLLAADGKVRQWLDVAAAAPVGTIGRIEVGFVAGGVLHLWSDESDEYADLTVAGDEATEAVEQLREAAAERAAAVGRASRGTAASNEFLVAREGEQLLRTLKPRVEQWAHQLVAADVFIGGSSQQARWRLAGEVIPELGAWRELPDRRENPQSWARRWAAGSACSRAEELLPAVKERRLAALRERVDEVAAKLAAEPEFIGRRTKPVRRQFVRDAVTAELGFGSAELTDRVLELADQARGQ